MELGQNVIQARGTAETLTAIFGAAFAKIIKLRGLHEESSFSPGTLWDVDIDVPNVAELTAYISQMQKQVEEWLQLDGFALNITVQTRNTSELLESWILRFILDNDVENETVLKQCLDSIVDCCSKMRPLADLSNIVVNVRAANVTPDPSSSGGNDNNSNIDDTNNSNNRSRKSNRNKADHHKVFFTYKVNVKFGDVHSERKSDRATLFISDDQGNDVELFDVKMNSVVSLTVTSRRPLDLNGGIKLSHSGPRGMVVYVEGMVVSDFSRNLTFMFAEGVWIGKARFGGSPLGKNAGEKIQRQTHEGKLFMNQQNEQRRWRPSSSNQAKKLVVPLTSDVDGMIAEIERWCRAIHGRFVHLEFHTQKLIAFAVIPVEVKKAAYVLMNLVKRTAAMRLGNSIYRKSKVVCILQGAVRRKLVSKNPDYIRAVCSGCLDRVRKISVQKPWLHPSVALFSKLPAGISQNLMSRFGDSKRGLPDVNMKVVLKRALIRDEEQRKIERTLSLLPTCVLRNNLRKIYQEAISASLTIQARLRRLLYRRRWRYLKRMTRFFVARLRYISKKVAAGTICHRIRLHEHSHNYVLSGKIIVGFVQRFMLNYMLNRLDDAGTIIASYCTRFCCRNRYMTMTQSASKLASSCSRTLKLKKLNTVRTSVRVIERAMVTTVKNLATTPGKKKNHSLFPSGITDLPPYRLFQCIMLRTPIRNAYCLLAHDSKKRDEDAKIIAERRRIQRNEEKLRNAVLTDNRDEQRFRIEHDLQEQSQLYEKRQTELQSEYVERQRYLQQQQIQLMAEMALAELRSSCGLLLSSRARSLVKRTELGARKLVAVTIIASIRRVEPLALYSVTMEVSQGGYQKGLWSGSSIVAEKNIALIHSKLTAKLFEEWVDDSRRKKAAIRLQASLRRSLYRKIRPMRKLLWRFKMLVPRARFSEMSAAAKFLCSFLMGLGDRCLFLELMKERNSATHVPTPTPPKRRARSAEYHHHPDRQNDSSFQPMVGDSLLVKRTPRPPSAPAAMAQRRHRIAVPNRMYKIPGDDSGMMMASLDVSKIPGDERDSDNASVEEPITVELDDDEILCDEDDQQFLVKLPPAVEPETSHKKKMKKGMHHHQQQQQQPSQEERNRAAEEELEKLHFQAAMLQSLASQIFKDPTEMSQWMARRALPWGVTWSSNMFNNNNNETAATSTTTMASTFNPKPPAYPAAGVQTVAAVRESVWRLRSNPLFDNPRGIKTPPTKHRKRMTSTG